MNKQLKTAWLTDIHLNFLEKNAREVYYKSIVDSDCDAIFISGDIAEAPSISDILKEMAMYVKKTIYFILGNHDFYRGSVARINQEMLSLTESEPFLNWLPAVGPQQLDNKTVLVGQDGWADGRAGDYFRSPVSLNDSRMIAELFQKKLLGKEALLEEMQTLADECASKLREDIDLAVTKNNPEKIIVLTHVPPFKEACLYEGKMTSDDFLPFFCSKVIGDVLLESANAHSNIVFMVLCGHTHERATYQPLSNLQVKVGGAVYGQPGIEEIIVITGDVP